MKIIGMISGTSADGIDVALCEITGTPPAIEAKILDAITQPYPPQLRERVLDACASNSNTQDICRLNTDLGEQFAIEALALLESAGISTSDIDLIGSHGQTVWHNVLENGEVDATLQLTEASIIAERTGITTIANFRARDVAAGGQGAPMAAYADWLLLRHDSHWRAVQNIGGIGNVTFLPPKSEAKGKPIAFDTGPGNVLIDSAMTYMTSGEQTYDHGGETALRGKVDEAWVAEMMQHPYYALPVPKTTGRELFSYDMACKHVDEGRERGLSDEDIIATLTDLSAYSIADAYHRFAPAKIGEVILGGGGPKNKALVKMLEAHVAPIGVYTHEDIGLKSDFKEALVFALLAYETWHMRTGNDPALTGASHPVVLGQITPGANFVDLSRRIWGNA